MIKKSDVLICAILCEGNINNIDSRKKLTSPGNHDSFLIIKWQIVKP